MVVTHNVSINGISIDEIELYFRLLKLITSSVHHNCHGNHPCWHGN